MSGSLPFAHSHTFSMRTAADEEVLVVRVRSPANEVGFGFTFCEDVDAARAMALADALARGQGLSVRDWLATRPSACLKKLQDEAPADHADHPWVRAWRAQISSERCEPPVRASAPGSGIDWGAEPAFCALRWLDG